HLSVVQIAQQPLGDDRVDEAEVLAETCFEANASVHFGLANSVPNGQRIGVGQTQRLFDDEVFASLGGCNCLTGMQRMGRADVNDVNVWVGQHRVQAAIRLHRD